jgi:hypothetical protein
VGGPFRRTLSEQPLLNTNGDEQVFDLTADPWEQDDRSDTPEGIVDILKFRKQVAQIMGEHAPPGTSRDSTVPRP